MTASAAEDIAAMDKVLALHTELHEQEKILAMYVAQRDEAVAEKTKNEETLTSLRNEEATLQSCIRDRRSTEERREALLSRVQALEEMNDLFVGHLSSWKLELTPTLPSKGGKTRMVYTHGDGSTHTVTIDYAAKAQAIICALTYAPSRKSRASSAATLMARLVRAMGPHWTAMVARAKALPALQTAMQRIDLEMGRMQALHADLDRVLQRFVVPGGVQAVEHVAAAEEGGDEAPRGMESVCSFTVSFSCLSPASKWAVHLEVKRGYPFGWVKITPQSEFGAKPLDVTGITDVAFGYGRLWRACEHLETIFNDECARLRKENDEEEED